MRTYYFVVILMLVVVAAGIFFYGYAILKTGTVEPDEAACTMEARECPDGSFVGRTGPNCEFAPCPPVGEQEADTEPYEVPDDVQSHIDEKADLVVLESPVPGEILESPLTVTGRARGPWYFEATFPIMLTDWDGRIIASHYAEAEGEWMTTEFVPFVGALQFESPYREGDPEFMRRGTLILHKSNASGLPEHDDALEIPVRFAPTSAE